MLVMSLALALLRLPPANIARYLWAVLFEVPFLWVINAWHGDQSYLYALTYGAFTAIILACILRIAWDSMRGQPYRLRIVVISLLLASVFAGIARYEMEGQFAWITLCEGFLLLWAGIVASFAGAYRPRWDLYVPMGCFWMAQSLFDFGWCLHGQRWEAVNWLVPPGMAFVFFLYLAWRLGISLGQ